MIVKFLSHWKNSIILQLSPCWINKGNESLGKFRKVKTKGILKLIQILKSSKDEKRCIRTSRMIVNLVQVVQVVR